MKKFTFVILHYLTLDDTYQCVESIIENISYENVKIVIVDNGSPNDSGKVLKEKYKGYSNIDVLLSKENLGFAKGNNLGFKYAKEELYSDFIALINNDTYIKQENFIQVALDKYDEYGYAVLGPDIITTKDNGHQNPHAEDLIKENDLINEIRHYKKLLFLNYIGIENYLRKIKLYLKKAEIQNNDYRSEREWVQVHGSCMIFSPKYVEIYDGLYSETFMYREEDILMYLLKNSELKSLYSPEIQIFHKEDSSTDQVYKKDYKKRRFYYKNMIKSSYILYNLMKKD